MYFAVVVNFKELKIFFSRETILVTVSQNGKKNNVSISINFETLNGQWNFTPI